MDGKPTPGDIPLQDPRVGSDPFPIANAHWEASGWSGNMSETGGVSDEYSDDRYYRTV